MATDDYSLPSDAPLSQEAGAPVDDLLDQLAPPPPSYEAGQNLAETLPVEFLLKVGQLVIRDAEADYQSSSSWRNKAAMHQKLYNSDSPDQLPDQPNVQIMHVPYTRRAVKLFKGKMFPQLYPASGEFLSLKVQSPGLEEIAWKCSLHMNLQLANKIVEYVPSHDRGMTQNLIEGQIFEVWWYDPVKGRPCQEICLAEDVWINYQAKIDDPSLPDTRITWRKRYQQHQLEALEDSGYYTNILKGRVDGEAVLIKPLFADDSYTEAGDPKPTSGPSTDDLSDRPIKAAADNSSGFERNEASPTSDHEVLEQDRMLKLPGEKRQRAVTVCVARQNGTVLRLSMREQEDPKDRARFQREMDIRDTQIQAQEAAQQAAMFDYQQQVEAYQQEANALAAQGLSPVSPPPSPPQLPAMVTPPEPAPIKKVPWNRWSKYDCEVNPEGALGQGIPHDVAGHNVVANKILTRVISLLGLNLTPTFIGSRQARFSRSDQTLELGKINESPLPPSQVQEGAGLFMIQHPPADPNWQKLVQLADSSAQEVTAFDVAAGAPGMSGETATEAEMRNSNATDNISMVAQRYNRARAVSLKNLAYINSLTLPEEGETIYVEGTPMVVTREDYAAIVDELQVTFTCDPNMESQAMQERRAMKMFQTAIQVVSTAVGQGPGAVGIVDPNTAVMLIRGAAANVFKSMKMPRQWTDAIVNAPLPQTAPMPPEGAPPGEMNGPPSPEQQPAPMEQGASEAPPIDRGGPTLAPAPFGPS